MYSNTVLFLVSVGQPMYSTQSVFGVCRTPMYSTQPVFGVCRASMYSTQSCFWCL